KGSPSRAIAADGVANAFELRHSMRLPNSINGDNGIRNFSDAASHSRWRAAARLWRRAIASRPAATANSVDCHRWLAKRKRKVVISSGPFGRAVPEAHVLSRHPGG